MNEQITPIAGFSGYWIDPEGNVYSGMEQRSPGGHAQGFKTVIHNHPIRQMKPTVTYGRKVVALYRGGKMFMRRVHILVLEAFRGPRPFIGAVTRHLDGNPLNNHIENLKWGTQAENIADRDQQGRTARGQHHGKSKLTDDAIRDIRSRKLYRGLFTLLAKQYEISITHASRIWHGEGWEHVK